MVDLPSVSAKIPLAQAPTSSVSGAQIAAPYAELADNLNKMGEVGNEVAGKLAQDAGTQAVGPDGQVTPPSLPIIGPASAEFARAARFESLAKVTPEIESQMTEMRLAHPNDPVAFQSAVQGFKDQLLQRPGFSDPAIRGPIEKTINNQAGANYRSLLESTNATNVSNTKTAVTSQISDLSNKMADLAFTGGIDSPEYKQAQANLQALYGELGNDPRFGYPKERIDSEVTQLVSQQKTMAIAGQAVRMMDGGDPNGRANAKKWLIDKVYNDPTLNLSLAQRHQAVTTAMGLMEAKSSENKALIDANSATTTTLLTQLKTSAPYNEITVNDAIAASAKIGDAESYYKLTFAKGMHDWDQTVRSLPLPQQIAALHNLNGMRDTSAAAGDAMNFFTGRGYSKEQAAGIVGNLIQESGLNPNTIHDNGTGLGIAGHRLERLDAMKAYAASKGKPVNDFQTQLEFIDQELNTTESSTGRALRGAKTAQDAAKAFINFERPQGWTAANPEAGDGFTNRVNNAVSLAGGTTNGITGGTGRAGEAWFNQARIEQVARTRDFLKTTAEGYVKTIEAQVNKTGELSDDLIRNASAVIAETGQTDLKQRMESALTAHYGVKEIDKLPEPVRAAWVQQARAGIDGPVAAQVYDHMAASIDATTKAMQDTPYSTYAARTQGKPPPAYNFSDPQNVAAVASNRAALQKSFRNNDGTGPVSVFEGKEAQGFATALTSGDPATAASSLNGLASLPDDVYQATLAQKDIATAVTSIMSSRDPQRMAAGMAAADKLWRASPADAQTALGAAAITKLQAWQALKGSFAPQELAERLNASDDPSTLKAREAAKEAADKETTSLAPGDIAYKMGTSWGIPILSRVANVVTGATPAVPFDSIKGGELVADYRTTYGALRAYGVDADKASDLAVQRLGSTWGISEAAGNQVMRNPPERSYPAIDGSHAWMQADLSKWIAGKAGPEMQSTNASLEMGIGGAGATRNWSLAGMISDSQTQAEIAAGKPPSYQVAIKKADGTLDIIPSRIAFDPSEHLAEYGARLDHRRQTVNFMRTGQEVEPMSNDQIAGIAGR